MKRPLVLLSVLFALAACDDHRGGRDGGDGDGGRDGGSARDAGALDADAPDLDAGLESDSGAALDGGTDAGAMPTDAGHDAGFDAGHDAGMDAGVPARSDHHIHIDVSNTCVMTVTPSEITIPSGQEAYFDWHNHSADYPVDVWMSYGGGFLDLAPGATWDEPIRHCGTPFPHQEYADIDTACSSHRFLIRCL